MSRNNNVRGPTSALTEFLREQGITPTTVARRAARQAAPQAEAGTSNANENTAEGSSVQESPRQGSGNDDEYNSDKLDDEENGRPSPKKRKLTKKAAEKAKAKEKAKKKKKGDEDDSDYEDDEYTALSKSVFTFNGSGNSPVKPPVGSFENCAKCSKQFTMTRYTVAANPGPGYLCHTCAKATGADPFKKPAPVRKRKNPENKRKIVNFDDRELPSLASICIKIISDHIEDVEALGDIGTVNMTEISRVLAKNRSLTPDNAPLLYDIRNTQLTLYDATRLGPPAFNTLASLNPALESLRLDYCGRIEDSSLEHWCGHLPSLRRIELYGPFLVRVEGWKTFFEAHPQLTGFLITQSPRFDLSCMESLVQNCPNLTELRLCQVGKMSDEFLPHIATLEHLTSLDLSETTQSLSTDAVVTLLEAVAANLTHLNLSSNALLGDAVLTEGVQPHARVLSSLVMDNVPDITDAGVAAFFTTFTDNPPLQKISLRRNHFLQDASLGALLSHSGETLTDLNINSWKEVSDESLKTIGTNAPHLRNLDIGWCREVDDFVIKDILKGCGKITNLSVYGCNRLTENCPRKRGVKIRGIETQAI